MSLPRRLWVADYGGEMLAACDQKIHPAMKRYEIAEPCDCPAAFTMKMLTTDQGVIRACERCSAHWFETYEEARKHG